MMRVLNILLTLALSFGCASVKATSHDSPRWIGTSENCDGTAIRSEVYYEVHIGGKSRADEGYPTNPVDRCESATVEDFTYSVGSVSIRDGQPLCEVMPEEGVWFVAMTATAAGERSAYSNELQLLVTPKARGQGFDCQTL